MTQQSESESKTEDHTEKKIFDQYERGNIPVSREASLFAATAATLLATVFMARSVLRSITLTLQEALSDPGGQTVHAASDTVALLSALASAKARPTATSNGAKTRWSRAKRFACRAASPLLRANGRLVFVLC
jgi:flagellar biosynthesis protein FlhB